MLALVAGTVSARLLPVTAATAAPSGPRTSGEHREAAVGGGETAVGSAVKYVRTDDGSVRQVR